MNMSPPIRRARLSRADERVLIRRYQRGDNAAGEELIQAHLGFLMSKAKLRDYGRYMDRDDALQEAKLGLLHAAKRFDLSRNVWLLTYAADWVWQNLDRAAWKARGEIRVPYAKYAKGHKNILADRLDEPLRTPQGDSGAMTFEETISDGRTAVDDEAHARIRQKHIRRVYEQALRGLTPREQFIARERLSWESRDKRTLLDIGKRIGVSRERVRQLERKVVAKLRVRLEKLGARELLAA